MSQNTHNEHVVDTESVIAWKARMSDCINKVDHQLKAKGLDADRQLKCMFASIVEQRKLSVQDIDDLVEMMQAFANANTHSH